MCWPCRRGHWRSRRTRRPVHDGLSCSRRTSDRTGWLCHLEKKMQKTFLDSIPPLVSNKFTKQNKQKNNNKKLQKTKKSKKKKWYRSKGHYQYFNRTKKYLLFANPLRRILFSNRNFFNQLLFDFFLSKFFSRIFPIFFASQQDFFFAERTSHWRNTTKQNENLNKKNQFFSFPQKNKKKLYAVSSDVDSPLTKKKIKKIKRSNTPKKLRKCCDHH